jgi:response regulator of citrate/malate metabolism
MIRTLVVEDNPVALDVNINYLQRVPGFVVAGVARNGAKAVAAARDQPLELILLDLGLPDMRELDVFRALRAARTPPIDIIPVTATRDADTVHDAIAYGAVQYLIKPYTFATFQEMLQRYAAYRQGLPSGEIISQPEVAQAVGKLRGSTNIALPKDLSPQTYERIVGVLRNADQPLSAAEIAGAVGVSRCTARRYLDHLHQQGLVVLTPRCGTKGRPLHLYQLNTLRGSTNTALPKDLSPQTYERIVGVLRNADQPLSAAEIAGAVGVSRCTARRYLDHLHQQDLVVLTVRSSTAGPVHLYQWAGRRRRKLSEGPEP